MSRRIGIAVSVDAVRAVAVRDGVVLWAAESSLDGRSIEEAVAELLSVRRVRGWPRPTIIAAVGPARAQLRRLSGLPPVVDGALSRLVGESAGRFFLKNGIPLVTTGVRRDGDFDSEGWAGAIEQPVVAALEAACRARGMRLTAVLPTLSVLPHALHGDSLTWRDGDVSARVFVAGGRLTGLHRAIGGSAASVLSDDVREVVAPLASLGADAWHYADAYGAAIASSRDPLAIHPARSPADAPMRPRRLVAAGIACSVALVAAVVSPTLMARHTAAQATAALSLLARQRRTAEAAESDLAHVSTALEEVATFDRDRQPVTLLLDDLAHALPAGGALVTVRVDSAGGTLVALAPRAAVLLERLEHVSSLSAPTFVGPVTREAAANAEVERVAIRFSRPRRAATAPASQRKP